MWQEIVERQLFGTSVVARRKYASSRVDQLELCTENGVEQAYKSPVNSLDLDQEENRYLLSSGVTSDIVIYDADHRDEFGIKSCKPVAHIEKSFAGAHKYSVSCIQWYPHDTGMFLSSSTDQTMKVWDTNTLQIAEQFDFHRPVSCHHMSSKATKHCLVAVASEDARVYLCDLKSGSKAHTLRGHQNAVLSLKWSPRNQHIIATGGADHRIFLWDIRRAKSCLMSLDRHNRKRKSPVNPVLTAHGGAVNGLQFTPDGLYLLSFGTDDRLVKWDLWNSRNTGVDFERNMNPSKKWMQFDISSDLNTDVVFVPSLCDICVRNLQTGALMKTLTGHYRGVNACVYSRLYQELYAASTDTQILSWKPKVEPVAFEEKENLVTDTERAAAYQDAWSSDEDGG